MTPVDDASLLFTPADAAAYLGRSVPALAQLRYRGTGPRFIRAGGRIRYRMTDIQAWLDQNTMSAT